VRAEEVDAAWEGLLGAVSALYRNEMLRREVPWQRELLEVGGQWIADRPADPAEIVAEARALGVRALTFAGKDLSFLPELPELEFLSLGDCADIAPAMSLPRLRGFSVVSWEGTLDASAWPRLERFAGSEPPKGGGGAETAYGHPHVEVLGLGRYAAPDLTPITAPRLRQLHLSGARLESLRGIDRLTGLEVLDVSRVPRLASLAGVETLPRLEILALDGARLITSLEHAAKAAALRFLDISDQRGIESLAPLAGHPTLEFVNFQRTGDMSLEALFDLPRLRTVIGYRTSKWDRDLDELPSLVALPDDHPDKAAYYEMRLRY
jgi:Leucine-rich repeat (LRR) protein